MCITRSRRNRDSCCFHHWRDGSQSFAAAGVDSRLLPQQRICSGHKGGAREQRGHEDRVRGTGSGRVVLTATDATQYAWEGRRVIGVAENSVFTYYLIQGLQTGEADRDADGLISLDELYDCVYDKVLDETSKQTPGKWSYRQQGEIIIAHNPRKADMERLAAEKAEAERKAAEKAEAERLQVDKVSAGPVIERPPLFVPTPSREKAKVHPYVPEALDQLQKGRITRRKFIYIVTILGVSLATAILWSTTNPTEPETNRPTSTLASSGTSGAAQGVTGNIKKGGTLTSAMELPAIDHPARISSITDSNVLRQVSEYLTETDENNITRPRLLKRWEPSEDLKTWTLHLRQGVKFNNGQELTADDIIFSFNEWLNPDVGSSTLGLFEGFLSANNIERVDDYTIRLHLDAPNLAVAENLFHYPAVILPRTFAGDFINQPIGTGAFTLEEYSPGERAVLKRREDYWRVGQDGQSLPYLDEIIYLDLGSDNEAAVAALQSGQVDSIFQPGVDDWLSLRELDGLTVRTADTSTGRILRMRVDLEPWSDVRVRTALKLCQDREKILQTAYFGQGSLSIDAHVAPIHPAYCEKLIPGYDPDQAKALLAEAGYSDGLDASISVGTGWPEAVAYAETL